jgi:hypothetical protein
VDVRAVVNLRRRVFSQILRKGGEKGKESQVSHRRRRRRGGKEKRKNLTKKAEF